MADTPSVIKNLKYLIKNSSSQIKKLKFIFNHIFLGTISIVDEYHNADGIWVRLGQDSLLEYCTPNYTEGWCLQYNQHLEKTLLVPVAEPKPAPRTTSNDRNVTSGSMPIPNPFASVTNAEPILKGKNLHILP